MAETTAVTRSELQTLLTTHKGQIAAALPSHMTPERMIRIAITAYTTTPALHKCDARTIAGCIVQSSILGLEPNSLLGEAYLVPFKRRYKEGNSWKTAWECQLIPGYKGLLKLARQSGEIKDIDAHEVRAKDYFEYSYVINPVLVHRPHPGSDEARGPVVAFWAMAALKSGGNQFLVMTQAQIEEHRDKFSSSYEADKDGKSAWAKHPVAMGKKTVIRMLCKLLPQSIEDRSLRTAVALDERNEAALAQRFSDDVPLEFHPPNPDFNGDDEDEDIIEGEMEPIGDVAARRESELHEELRKGEETEERQAEQSDELTVRRELILSYKERLPEAVYWRIIGAAGYDDVGQIPLDQCHHIAKQMEEEHQANLEKVDPKPAEAMIDESEKREPLRMPERKSETQRLQFGKRPDKK